MEKSVSELLAKVERVAQIRLQPLQSSSTTGTGTVLVSNDRIHMDHEMLKERSTFSSLHQSESIHTYRTSLNTYRNLRTYRSNLSAGSIDSHEDSLQTNRSLRSLLQEIEARAEKDEEPPSFVSKIEALPPSLISWNGRPLRPVRGLKSKKKINIIGCHQSVELILAKADERTRKQKKAADKARLATHEGHGNMVDKIMLRHERKTEMVQQSDTAKQNALFLKIVQVITYAYTLETRYRETYTVHNWNAYINRAAVRIARMVSRWHARVVARRFMQVQRVIGQNIWVFRLRARILRKRRALTRLSNFLQACKGHQAFSVVISRYLKSIRKIQRGLREWMRCKHSRILVLDKLWMSLEQKYIRRMLKQRMKKKVLLSRGAKAQTLFDELNLNQKTRLELEKQNVQWDSIDAQIVAKLESHRKSRGDAVISLNDEQVRQMELGEETRYEVLKDLLEKTRKAYIKAQVALNAVANVATIQSFSVADARDLIQDRPIRQAAPKTLSTIKARSRTSIEKRAAPFPMLKLITPAIVLEVIHREHDRLKTFEVKFDKSDYVKHNGPHVLRNHTGPG